jgi:YesN/AraC family two-component response regulator
MAPLRVMIVEDHPLALTSLRALLSRMSEFSVVATARNGAEALPLIQEIQPEVLILDIKMPEMTGWELLNELHRKNISVQVIVLTAFPQEIAKYQAFYEDKDIVAYLTKDNAALLLDTLQKIANNHNGAT